MKKLSCIILLLLAVLQLNAQDNTIANRIRGQADRYGTEGKLHFPASLKRFYADNRYQPVWIKPQSGMGRTWQAMLMLDCVQQFGLLHGDYHPKELSYDSLHVILEQPEKLSPDEQVRFELMLTDAMITFLNNLHYGKLNPKYPAGRVDRATDVPFLATTALKHALQHKDFMQAIVAVQPNDRRYLELQEFLRMAKGQYDGDCYETPEADIRLAAINMERLRWASFEKEATVYLTCGIEGGQLKRYKDVHHLDRDLEDRMYNPIKK